MAYDEYLAERIEHVLSDKKILFEAKKMMGGITFMVNGSMLVGVVSNKLMARVGELNYDQSLQKQYCNPMDFTGRPLKGFVFIEPEGIDMDSDLEYWIQLCIDFNPMAKGSKK